MQEKEVNATIGKNIRIRRSLKGYSQSDLANLLGVTFQQVQKYENGRNMVSPTKLLQLSGIFECGLEELFFNQDFYGEKKEPMGIPSRRSIHLVQSFERIKSLPIQKHIGDLVRAIADQQEPEWENS